MKRSSTNTPFPALVLFILIARFMYSCFFLSRWFEAGRTHNNKAVLCKNQDLFDF